MSSSGSELTSFQLRALLIASDAIGFAAGYGLALWILHYPDRAGIWKTLAVMALAAAGGVILQRRQELYRSRVSTIRAVELSRTLRATVILGLLSMLVERVLPISIRVRHAVLASIFSLILVIAGRSMFRAWMGVRRNMGKYLREVVVVGTDHQSRRLIDIFEIHAELGIRVRGCVGSRATAKINELDDRWLGELDALPRVTAERGITGVFLTSAALSSPTLNTMIRDLQNAGLHVQIATGMSGLHQRRVRTLPVAYEPMLYVEKWSLSQAQIFAKRLFDIVVSSIVVIVASPVLALIAVWIKLDSKGPVLFHQTRVGHKGRHFSVLKFRTMVVDAEAQLAKLNAGNERSGPLFKMDRDPRVTRVGNLLRLSSLDELPQLFNVLRGDMSLVGPRPALPKEVEEFPAALRARENVMPGITGLWQMEARDNPSFDAYHRLDLFYVENWSLTLDLVILLGTVEQVVRRVVFRSKSSTEADAADDNAKALAGSS